MDPITLVVTAVALGASAGLKDAAAQAVKDAYAGLKQLLTGRQVDVSGMERKPGSPAQQAALTVWGSRTRPWGLISGFRLRSRTR